MNLPRHKQIETDLLNKIESGHYKENETIPTEMQLAELYEVSRPTVRQAIQTLVNEGYLEKRKKRGTIVKQRKISQEFTYIIESFDSEMNRKGLTPKTKVLAFKEEGANATVAESLQIKEDDPVYKLIRLRYAEEYPIVLVTTYLPKDLLPNLSTYDFQTTRLYTTLKDLGSPVVTIQRHLEALKADETTSDLLDIKENDPIFYFRSIGLTKDRIPVEYSISKYRGDKNSFVFELSNNSEE